MFEGKFVSADSHVVEPPDLWVTRMDKRFRDRAPHLEERADGDYFHIEGMPALSVGFEGAMMEDKIKGEITSATGRRYSDVPRGAWDPIARRLDMERDNVRAEVVYPGKAIHLWYSPDDEYVRACIQVYNDWLAEFCAGQPDKFIGAALIPIKGPEEWAVQEIERTAKMGLRTFLMPAKVDDCPYGLPKYDSMWAAVRATGFPIGYHAGTGTGDALFNKVQTGGFGATLVESKVWMPMRALVDLIWAGIPERFPELKFVIVEGGIGWIASLLNFMDHWWNDHKQWMQPQLKEPPSAYFKRNFWATFEDDRAGLLTRELLGVDRLLWGSDYPHTEGTFPHSREHVAKDFAGIPGEEVRAMVGGNAAKLYGIKD